MLRQLVEVGGERSTVIYYFSLKCQMENLSLGLRAIKLIFRTRFIYLKFFYWGVGFRLAYISNLAKQYKRVQISSEINECLPQVSEIHYKIYNSTCEEICSCMRGSPHCIVR